MKPRILVIDDNPAHRLLMTQLLQAGRCEALSANDGESGLALAREALPDAVVCQLYLPGMDGYEVLRRLRAAPRTQGIAVVALTAFAAVGPLDDILLPGFNGCIAKPVSPATFVAHLRGIISRAGGATG